MQIDGYDLIQDMDIFRNHLKWILIKSGKKSILSCSNFNKLFDFKQLVLYLVKIIFKLIYLKIIISVCHAYYMFLFLIFFHGRDHTGEDDKCPSIPLIDIFQYSV